jgi:hypothetical protein
MDSGNYLSFSIFYHKFDRNNINRRETNILFIFIFVNIVQLDDRSIVVNVLQITANTGTLEGTEQQLLATYRTCPSFEQFLPTTRHQSPFI